MQKITPCLWFDGKAEEAARFYTSVFKNSKMGAITRYGETGPGKKGSERSIEKVKHLVPRAGSPRLLPSSWQTVGGLPPAASTDAPWRSRCPGANRG